MELREDYTELIEKWRKRIFHSYIIVAGVIFVTEILMFALMQIRGTIQTDVVTYWFFYILLPSGINAVFTLITHKIIYGSAGQRWKNIAVIMCPLGYCVVIASFHGFFLMTSSIFVIPMAVSVMFGEEKVVRRTTLGSAVAMLLSIFPARLLDDNWTMRDRCDNALAALIFLGVANVICVSMLRFVKEKNEIIFNSASQNAEMRQALKVDAMTGLYNHTEFYRRLEIYYYQYRKQKELRLTVAVVDVDFFKRVNDTYGHENGDAVLVQIAAILREHCKPSGGHLFRYGGEEFAVIFRHKSAEEVAELMNEARRAINETQFERMPEERLGISCGIYEYRGEEIESQEIFSRADKALYRAKACGRNQCICYKKM